MGENREAIFYNALNILNSANRRELQNLENKFGSWEKSWQSLNKNEKILDPEKEWQELEKLGVRIILEKDENYPPLLKEIPQPPLGIYLMGAPIPKTKPAIAIVGTRKASPSGKEIAEKFARQLAESGLVIVSGLALGIDAAAHEGALKTGKQTIAVLGNGLDNFYPRQNEHLAKRILSSGGTIISEYPLGMPSLPHQFLERNRIVSGLSRGVLVVEAPKISGALGTAAHALNQNREVFVIPGAINNSNYEGSNDLIRVGAELITKPEEILKSLNIEANPKGTGESNLDTEEKEILEILKNASEALSADQIGEIADADVPLINKILSLLVIKNAVSESQGKYSSKL
jgi:DNA processing protein